MKIQNLNLTNNKINIFYCHSKINRQNLKSNYFQFLIIPKHLNIGTQ